ncbi:MULTISPECIES: hypothetical protein [unclassified Bradyrhizobium]|uniref:hypothetical protein n=1 Tax=unclassified Bradyrhizobium TaxID=2631580 RepID=UPI001BACA356|nr:MULTISPECIES: hypothetical protein [unclassified Bradyrhizobium]MBR1204081.1 hypothetical protein [Bradyrhizobium sp. AUGA SZCCT0124]MBR1310033.1 hypothetical protein [Bradyrhizobium sp. AUGA SZCCT0051]MBR1340174.1 hypothetical protein [Bradyrhizobium sp. AUGA SZCCT0105]MBR1354781.1 hypothetical protein [Bradyrhizobium sp. AUGA SZCCT0045]
MLEANLQRLRAHRRNIDRYRRLLATRLSDLERRYIERRLSEEQASATGLLRDAFPDRLCALLPRIEGRTTTLEMAALLDPAGAFAHPMDVVDDCDLTPYEKRAILSSWAANGCAVAGPSQPSQDNAVSFDDIVDALHLVEPEPEAATDHGNGSGRQQGRDGPDTVSIDV